MADGIDAICISLPFINDISWQLFFGTGSPINVGGYSDPQVDALIGQLATTDDPAARTELLQTLAGTVDKGAPWLDVVNDRNPRAFSPSVTGFTAPQSWFIDLTTVSVD